MPTVAILGAGAGGMAAAVQLGQAGYEIRLWSRTRKTIEPIVASGLVRATGAVEGTAAPALVTDDLSEVLAGADVGVICLPGLSHARVAEDLARIASPLPPLVFCPGAIGSALMLETALRSADRAVPAIGEISTLPYVARKSAPSVVGVTGVARQLRAAALAGGQEAADWALRLFPMCEAAADVVEVGMANVNLVLHPPAAILGAAWVEATAGGFKFYSEATTPGVIRTLAGLDAERLQTAQAFGHELPPLVAEMARIGTVDEGSVDLAAIGARVGPNAAIPAPDSLVHRYYTEDVLGTLPRFIALAELVGVATPVAEALVTLGTVACGVSRTSSADVLAQLGITPGDVGSLAGRIAAPTERPEAGGPRDAR